MRGQRDSARYLYCCEFCERAVAVSDFSVPFITRALCIHHCRTIHHSIADKLNSDAVWFHLFAACVLSNSARRECDPLLLRFHCWLMAKVILYERRARETRTHSHFQRTCCRCQYFCINTSHGLAVCYGADMHFCQCVSARIYDAAPGLSWNMYMFPCEKRNAVNTQYHDCISKWVKLLLIFCASIFQCWSNHFCFVRGKRYVTCELKKINTF
jgi:hypothetical protein